MFTQVFEIFVDTLSDNNFLSVTISSNNLTYFIFGVVNGLMLISSFQRQQ